MGFIQRVQERVNRPDDYLVFKNLLTAYQFANQAGVLFPRVYLDLKIEDDGANDEFDWNNFAPRLPSIFVMRPSVFLNNRFDYFLRDDGINGMKNYTVDEQHSHQDIFQNQVDNIRDIKSIQTPSLLFEEFPLTGCSLRYPPHYRMHMFYDEVGLMQITTQDKTFWINDDKKVIGGANTNLIPNDHDHEDLCEAASAISMRASLPYIRVDFVLSSRGAMFRSFACTPGDIRSDKNNWFYKKLDQDLEQRWIEAEQRITEDKEPESVANPTTAATAPDDNA